MTLREKENILRPDMIQLLMQAKQGALKNDDKEEAADAGFATASESQTTKPHTIKRGQDNDYSKICFN